MKTQNIALIVVGCVALAVVGAGLVLGLALQLGGHGVDFAPLAFNEAFGDNTEKPCTNEEVNAVRGIVVKAADYRLSGPYTHENLAVYLIHGQDTMKGAKVVTLQEALAQNQAVVHETGMGNLAVDNRGAVPLFIQAGDIVKGGTQDRVLPYDLLVPPQTSRQTLPALCVEQGRCFPRGDEISTSFQSATEQLPGQRLKLAASRQAQGDVWAGVQNLQANLSRNAGGPVQSAQSRTSLQLSLENHRVQQAIGDYLRELTPAPQAHRDVIGFAVAVNGKIHSADVYASSALFEELWPKLIKASSVAALAECNPGEAAPAPATATVSAFLTEAETGQAFQQTIGQGAINIRHEGRNLLFDTCDPSQANLVLHRSFLAK